jgi:hypothetical protein
MFSRRLRLAGAAALIGALLGAQSEAQAACASAAEVSGLQARVLQTELMVAALSCGEAARYNAFVNRFRSELVVESKHMQRYFSRVHGGRAGKELNAFVTELANNSSQRSLTEAASFCPRAAALLDDVLKIEPRQLRSFAAELSFADAHGVDSCDGPREARGKQPATAATLLTEVKLPAEKPVRVP